MDIHNACKKGHLKKIKYLISQNVNLEESDVVGWRPIHYACFYNRYKTVRYLLDKVNLEAETDTQMRPIHVACMRGLKNIVKLLMEKVNLEVTDRLNRTPVHLVCGECNRKELLKLLLDKVNLEVQDFYGRRPIHYVCCSNDLSMLKLLINKVNLEAETCNKWRPIHYACARGATDLVKLLIDGFVDNKVHLTRSRVNLFCRDNYGKLPYDIAVNKDIKDFLMTKMNLEKRTIFEKLNIEFMDISIKLIN